jgi:hypothetical protein
VHVSTVNTLLVSSLLLDACRKHLAFIICQLGIFTSGSHLIT